MKKNLSKQLRNPGAQISSNDRGALGSTPPLQKNILKEARDVSVLSREVMDKIKIKTVEHVTPSRMVLRIK